MEPLQAPCTPQKYPYSLYWRSAEVGDCQPGGVANKAGTTRVIIQILSSNIPPSRPARRWSAVSSLHRRDLFISRQKRYRLLRAAMRR